MPARGIRWRRTRCLGGRLSRGLLSPALTRMRRRVVLPMSMPSRSLSNSLRWVWLAPSYLGASQVHHIGHHGIGRCVGWLAAPVAVSHGGGSLLPVSRQHASGVASGDTHQHGCLVQCHVLSEQTVQNLKSCLFFRSQSHILHSVNMTFMLAS